MTYSLTRRSFVGACGIAGALVLAGCASSGASSSASSASSAASASSASASQGAASSSAAAKIPKVTIGTLPTEDILPMWVSEESGTGFEGNGGSVEVVEFQSATELIAGVGSGSVDMAMTDIMVAASMFANGIDVQIEWVTLGTDPSQGRFGIIAGPKSDVQTLQDLAGVPIGVGTNTILEYVMDCLMEGAGVPADQVKVEEIQKLPVRFQAMMNGDVAAAALPGPLLALGEANGCKLVADDTQGRNISQSVMIARAGFAASNPEAVQAVAQAWDAAVALINANPESYRELLVRRANLSDAVASTYPISTYPTVQLPTNDMVASVLSWMKNKGYLTASLSYDESTGLFVSQ